MWWEENFTQRFSSHPYQRDAGHESRPSHPVGRPAPASTHIGRLDTRHNKHWPDCNPMRRRCRVCSAVMFKCVRCDVALCVDLTCFADYHIKTTYGIFSSVLHANSKSLYHNVSKRTWIFTSTYFLKRMFSITQ
jgi:hypothetical protein